MKLPLRTNQCKSLLASLLAVFTTQLIAQDSLSHTYRLSTSAIQLITLDFPITFEFVKPRHTLGFTFSYSPSTKRAGEIKGFGSGALRDYPFQNVFNPLYHGFTIGSNTKYYYGKRKVLFLEAQVYFRHWWFKNKHAQFDNEEGYRFNANRTERQNVYGLKILWGRTFSLAKIGNKKPIIDFYGGLSFRQKTFHFQSLNGTVNDVFYNYKVDKGDDFIFNYMMGFKIGIEWEKKHSYNTK